jgi:chemotaxis protein MotB
MRTCLGISLAMLVSGMLLTGGCVAKTEYDDLLAANRRTQQFLEQANATVRQLQSENKDLKDKQAQYESAILKYQNDIAVLEKKNKDLQDAYDTLLAKYKGTEIKPPELLEGPILPLPLHEALRKWAEENKDWVTYYPKLGMVKLNADLTFDKGSDDVSAQAKEALRKFADIVSKAGALRFNIYIAGHTDDIPILKPDTKRRHPTNWYLSVHRGVCVLKELTDAGVAQKRVAAMGFGEWHPIAPNAPGNKGNQANRRVEIWIVSPERFLTITGDAGAPAGGEEK